MLIARSPRPRVIELGDHLTQPYEPAEFNVDNLQAEVCDQPTDGLNGRLRLRVVRWRWAKLGAGRMDGWI